MLLARDLLSIFLSIMKKKKKMRAKISVVRGWPSSRPRVVWGKPEMFIANWNKKLFDGNRTWNCFLCVSIDHFLVNGLWLLRILTDVPIFFSFCCWIHVEFELLWLLLKIEKPSLGHKRSRGETRIHVQKNVFWRDCTK